MKTFDDIRDTAIKIVDDLVEQGIIKDCKDTENEEEFNIQDIIVFRLLESQKNEILKLYTKDKLSDNDKDLIDNLIDYGAIETDEIKDDWQGWAQDHNDLLIEDNYKLFMNFNKHYDNRKTHNQNWEKFILRVIYT
ncbi:MAG: hypothetical protein R6U15_07995 [Candidatus Izemoplasmatales bacterium]